MNFIKTPYNFVPFNRQPVYPHWGKYISHDIPFKDGHSGSIRLKLTAESPIFVKDGMSEKEEESFYQKLKGKNGDKEKQVQSRPYSFHQWNGNYFIPATSIKGMIRNVLEIISFGRMSPKVDNHRYAIRDLSSGMKGTYLNNFDPYSIYCGWLQKTQDDQYQLTDCGIPGRISHEELDKHFKTDFSTYFAKGGGFKPRLDKEKAAKHKYTKFNGNPRQASFKFVEESYKRQVYNIDPRGTDKGELVFTGQSGPREKRGNKWLGHHLEFIFFDRPENENLPVPDSVITDFFFAYYEHDSTKWSVDWKVWRAKLEKGEKIPVFFQKNENGIKHMGLSYLYKLPYTYSVHETINQTQKESKIDLSEAIFGHVDQTNRKLLLKGRVQPGHAFAIHAEVDEEKREVLASPRASFYPNYIRQQIGKNGKVNPYKSFMNKGAEIAGWKRYPIHSNGTSTNPKPEKSQDSILTRFVPLKKGATFTCVIHYHNLRTIELGALFSAITFHQTSGTFHSLGMAKALGYGKLNVEIQDTGDIDPDACMATFETYMNAAMGLQEPAWHLSDQIVELVTMAKGFPGAPLEYMSLKDHREAKKAQEALPVYSKLVKQKASINSLSSKERIAKMHKQLTEEKKLFKQALPPEEIVDLALQTTKRDLYLAWEQKKEEVIQQIRQRQTEVENEEEEARIAQEAKNHEDERRKRQELAEKHGPNWENLDLKHKNAFKELMKVIERFGRDYYMANDKDLQNNYPNGYLPEKYHNDLLQKLSEIYGSAGKRDQKEWRKTEHNSFKKKIAEWIGSSNADDWINPLK